MYFFPSCVILENQNFLLPFNYCRTIPLSVIISMTAVTVIYLLVNIAYFSLLSEEEILSSNAIALVDTYFHENYQDPSCNS